jgi:glycosyltransferase involved in cell wall biosynthesis
VALARRPRSGVELTPAKCRVAVVIPVYNRRETTLQCLRSLSRMRADHLDVHTIVIDDGSTDGTSEAIRRDFPAVELLHGDGTLFYTGGMNLGLDAARRIDPDCVLAMNDDVEVEPELLLALIDCARRHPRTIVGALLLRADDPHRLLQVGVTWRTWYGGWHVPLDLTVADVPREPWTAEVIVGNCVLYPAEAIRDAGPMNARLFPHAGSDVEYTSRLRRLGWQLAIAPAARVRCGPNVYPPPLRSQPLGQALTRVLVDRRQAVNLTRQVMERWTTAPSRWQGVAASIVLLGRWTLKALGLGGSWPRWADPPFRGRPCA